MEAEKSRKLSMMNSSLGEKLIEEETAEEGAVSNHLLYDNYCVKSLQSICYIVLSHVLPIGENCQIKSCKDSKITTQWRI